MSIEQIKNLVNKEKENEKEIQQAKEEAERIVKEGKTEARRIMNDIEDHRYLNKLFEAELKKIEEKKKILEREFAEEYSNLQKTGERNMEEAITQVLRLALGE